MKKNRLLSTTLAPRAQNAGGVACLAVAALCMSVAGCGYTNGDLYNRSIETVAVPVFGNKTYQKGLEMNLTEALDKNIEARTPYRLESEDHADSELSGEIIQVAQNVVGNNYNTNLPQETEVTVVVRFTWKDLRTGRVLVDRKQFARSAMEIPDVNERTIDAEQQAVQDLAEGIVDQMQKDW